jgi:hypothetical protein
MGHQSSEADERFRRDFEACVVQPAAFDHAAHVRLAYVYLCDQPLDGAAAHMKRAILAFLQHLGADSRKFHETLTRAWIMALHHFMTRCSPCESAADFMAKNPELLDSKIMLTHYSASVLFSEEARDKFVVPDVQPIPPPR